MKGVNKCILIGSLGRDAEVKYTAGGSAVTTISIATSESWKDKQTGQQQEKTEWHRVILFGRLAEVAGDYLRKGNKVYIEGSLRTNKWQDKDGHDKYTTEIIARDMQMLDSRENNTSQDSGAHTIAPTKQQPPISAQKEAQGFDIDDDIPF